MASKGVSDDPLRGGGAFDDQDMEDLTAHLANLPTGRSSHDGLDLGDNSELLQGNLDRFRVLAGNDPNDDLFRSYGGLGLGLDVNDPTIITTTNYPTYGELAAAKPPSYEDSILYEQAPLGLHAAAGGTGGAGDDSLSIPAASCSSPVGAVARPSSSTLPMGGLVSEPLLAAAANMVSGVAAWSSMGPSGGLEPPPPPLLAAAGPAATGSNTVTGGFRRPPAATSSASAAAGPSAPRPPHLDSFPLPGSRDFRLDDIQALSPQQYHLQPSPSTTPTSLMMQPPGPTEVATGTDGGGGGDGISIGNTSSGAVQQHQQLFITVSEPIKREHGGLFGIKGGYVTYLVRAKARPDRASGLSSRETTVRRRFREFVALAELLKEKYRGYFVPPRPEKNAVEGQRMTDVFVEERRLALERYLNKLARHPVISASEELRLFLEAEGDLADCTSWLALRPAGLGGSVLEGTAKFSKQILGLDRVVTDPVQAAQPTKKATDFMRAIKETARSMQSSPSSSPLPPDEVALAAAREEVEALQGSLATASRAAEKLVSRLDRWSVVQLELGLALVQIWKAEKADGVALANHTGTLKQSGNLMHDTERLGTALVRSSRIGRKVTGRCAIELGCLHEYLGLMPAARKGLRARDKALLTADTLQCDLEGRRRAIAELEVAGAKVLGGDAAKAKKVAEFSADVAVLEQSVVAAGARYDKIKEINQQEMSRLRSELRSDLMTMLHHYAAIMSACSQRHLEIWLQAACELQALPEQIQAAKACLVGGGGAVASQPKTQPLQPQHPSSIEHYHQHQQQQQQHQQQQQQYQQQQYQQQHPYSSVVPYGRGGGGGGAGPSGSGGGGGGGTRWGPLGSEPLALGDVPRGGFEEGGGGGERGGVGGLPRAAAAAAKVMEPVRGYPL